jgi:hypothetical protein
MGLGVDICARYSSGKAQEKASPAGLAKIRAKIKSLL